MHRAVPPSVRLTSLVAVLALAAAACLPAAIRPTPAPTPTPTPVPSAPPTPTPTPGPPTPTPAPTFAVYTVRRGDNLTSVAAKFHTSPRSIAYWNRDRYPTLDPESAKYAPNNLQLGWTLKIMPGQEYSPPPNDGETGVDQTPEPTDEPSPDASSWPDASASPGASAGG